MSRHVTSCHVMLRHVTSCHVMSRHATSRSVTSCHVMSRHVMLRRGTSCHVESLGTVTRPTLHCQLTFSTRNSFELSMTVFVGCPEGCRFHTALAVYDLVLFQHFSNYAGRSDRYIKIIRMRTNKFNFGSSARLYNLAPKAFRQVNQLFNFCFGVLNFKTRISSPHESVQTPKIM